MDDVLQRCGRNEPVAFAFDEYQVQRPGVGECHGLAVGKVSTIAALINDARLDALGDVAGGKPWSGDRVPGDLSAQDAVVTGERGADLVIHAQGDDLVVMVKPLGSTELADCPDDVQPQPGADAFGDGGENMQLGALLRLTPHFLEPGQDRLFKQLQRQDLELLDIQPLSKQGPGQQWLVVFGILDLSMASETIPQVDAQAGRSASGSNEEQAFLNECLHRGRQALLAHDVAAEDAVRRESGIALHHRVQRQFHCTEADAGNLIGMNAALRIAGGHAHARQQRAVLVLANAHSEPVQPLIHAIDDQPSQDHDHLGCVQGVADPELAGLRRRRVKDQATVLRVMADRGLQVAHFRTPGDFRATECIDSTESVDFFTVVTHLAIIAMSKQGVAGNHVIDDAGNQGIVISAQVTGTLQQQAEIGLTGLAQPHGVVHVATA
jgi:hypothetical protein